MVTKFMGVINYSLNKTHRTETVYLANGLINKWHNPKCGS